MDLEFMKSEIERLNKETEHLKQINNFFKWYFRILIVIVGVLVGYVILS